MPNLIYIYKREEGYMLSPSLNVQKRKESHPQQECATRKYEPIFLKILS